MPIVRIDITGPKSAEYKRALLAGGRKAVVEALGVPDERVTLRVFETPWVDVDVPPCRSDRFTVVEILMYEGRTAELKRAVCDAIRREYALSPGVEASEVMIHLHDAAKLDLDVPAGEAKPRG